MKNGDLNITLIVAAHKPAPMPSDGMYLPVQVGALGKPDIGYARDDSGNHISGKNAGFCELTGIWWAWKNLNYDYLGLCHYRRFFAGSRHGKPEERILTREQLLPLLERYAVILPKPRNYLVETNYTQYIHAHHEQDLTLTRQILSELDPEALPFYDRSMKSTVGHRFNMFIMKREQADAWLSWLFPVLLELEKRLDTSTYSDYDKRVFGFVAERLLDVWLAKTNTGYYELPVVNTEGENLMKKGAGMLLRKLHGGKK